MKIIIRDIIITDFRDMCYLLIPPKDCKEDELFINIEEQFYK